ncbi:MAG: TetR/AcrR family transcriptional regulator [bacterium]|nr:TetR/AcrR family transcriptional regulator [bacterium]
MPEPARAKPGRPRDPSKDDAALEATTALIAENGFHRLRIDDIAARAGIPKSTIYRRWPSLHALVIDAYRVAFPVPDFDPDLDPFEFIDLVIDATASVVERDALGATLPIAGATIMQDEDLAEQFAAAFVDPYMEALTGAIQRGEAEGRFTTALPAEDLAAMVMGRFAMGAIFKRRRTDPAAIKKSVRVLLGVPQSP